MREREGGRDSHHLPMQAGAIIRKTFRTGIVDKVKTDTDPVTETDLVRSRPERESPWYHIQRVAEWGREGGRKICRKPNLSPTRPT